MKALLTWLSAFLAAPLVVGLLVEILKPWLPDGAAVVSWAALMFEAAAFPWVTAGAAGLLLGLWLDKVSARFDGRHPLTKAGKAKMLSAEASLLGMQIENSLSHLWGAAKPDPTDYIRAIAMFQRISPLGLATPPPLRGDQNPAEIMRVYAAYLRQVAVPMAHGDIALAKSVAEAFRDRA